MSLATLPDSDQFVLQDLRTRYAHLTDLLCNTTDKFDADYFEEELLSIEVQLVRLGEEI